MSRGSVRLGRLFGVEIALHFSWFVIAALLTISLAGHLYAVGAGWSGLVIWTAAAVAAAAFFAAIVLHELSHAIVARLRGVEVPSITLWALGGMAHMKRDTADARSEFCMGLAGPIASVVIGLAALGLAHVMGWNRTTTPATPGMAMLVWFGFINLTLAAFNMIPGFPLDGGRVLRALIWWRTGNQMQATQTASRIGQAVASIFIAVGLLSFVFARGFGGLWLAFIGLFLNAAARANVAQTTVAAGLRDVRVRDVMSHECVNIESRTSVANVADEVLRTGNRCFFVVDDGRVAGMVTPRELREVPRDLWASTPAARIMKPVEELHRIDADAPVTEALDAITHEDVNQLPVLEEGTIRGVISREQIQSLIAARVELTRKSA